MKVIPETQLNIYVFNTVTFYLQNITSDMALEDITGRALPAIDVFSLSIRALKEHLIKELVKQGTGLKVDEIQWVLTVPAIWSDSAKQFMRASAEKVLYVTKIDKS